MRPVCLLSLVWVPLWHVLFCDAFTTRPITEFQRRRLFHHHHDKTTSIHTTCSRVGSSLRLLMTASEDQEGEEEGSSANTTDTDTSIPTTLGATTSSKQKKQSTVAAVASTKDTSTMFGAKPSFKLTKSSSSSSTSSSTGRASSATNKKESRWDSFDYYQHWYPVTWACDVLPDRPTKVTLFDVDYVIAYDSTRQQWTALRDQCPHKAAALSEGRLTESGFIQCAYHGWSFNGTTGDCVQIPQSIQDVTTDPTVTNFPARACAKPIAICEHQSMVWLWPGTDNIPTKTPPSVPEMELPGWRITRVVRDFPMVDWSLLVSNILDPDHGAFAHQNLNFDFYTASPHHPQTITENFDQNGWELTASVPAVDKLLAVDRAKRQFLGMKTKPPKKTKPASFGSTPETPPEETLQATSHFMAPTTVSMSRRNVTDGSTKFITAFWVCPVGTGKSRFMSAAIGQVPIQVPRWILQVNLNRFLDQDTVLVASQQPPILTAEAQGVERPRASLFAYGSATDKTVRLIDNFWDTTLHKAPNRARTLQQLHYAGALQHTPAREIVLDRRTQHLTICPDSQGLVRNCRRITRTGLLLTAAWMARVLWLRAIPKRTLPLAVLSTLVAWAAHQVRKQYYFVKTEASRDKDLSQIPVKAWVDP
ncbi:TIC 55, chloroplastic [Seminavis robusta]|uniref:TIC 55, chloroplastic n=1 Tax=Seminavis robusta TaxID=568900 RepID=A0A9N8HAB1_9STRA|nr:TIC 55, chloroplastic [Seminavis robusta]|eukprot:Sro288_g108920.1 TIC 55, chloroplastic (648) ;mRNA; r:78483-80426